MPKQTKTIRKTFLLRAAAVLLIGVSLIGSTGSYVTADQYDEQIKSLNNQNNDSKNALNGLQAQAGSYQQAITQLQGQIDALQGALAANEGQQAAVQQQITDAQAKITQQKAFLSDNLRSMYVDGQMSTIEELATSKNLSDYVDKEEYRNAVQKKINATIKQIADLQAKLQKQKQDLDVLIASQRQQNAQLASARSEQQNLLSYNQSQQDNYNGQIAANSSKIADLKRQQVIANARFTGGGAAGTGPTCGGGYPAKWCNAAQDSLIDSWGMYNRECVSYTAFRVAASGRYMPYWGGVGNANQWDDNARRAGIPTDSNPRPGDVAISNSGYYGHAMYVEAVNSDGTIFVSQYNAALDGRYSTRTLSPGGLVFIHF